MHRLFPVLVGFCCMLSARAQTCLLIVRSDGRPSAGLLARNEFGATIGTVDDLGRLCPREPPDTLVFMGRGFGTVRIAWADASRSGRIDLPAAPKATELGAVAVLPWPAPQDRQALAAASTLDSTDISAWERSSLRGALLWVPGVQMDERGHGGSTRLSIRGSLLRSPYGVRGVKVYWGPFPLTLADGSTPLELLDPELIGSMAVVRSIGGPVYGSAPSGLILATPPEKQDTGYDARLSMVGGGYGYFKLSAGSRAHLSNGSTLGVGLLRMGNDGYRDQEYARRDQAFITQRYPVRNGSASIFLTFQKAAWGLPGSLDSLTATDRPRSARPFSQLIDARVEKSQVFAGIAMEQRVWQGVLMRSSLQVQSIDKVNPYGTSPGFSGCKDEQIRSAGTRLSLGRSFQSGSVEFSWELGLEALLERDQLQERAFVNALPGDVRTDADTRSSNLNGFLSLRSRIAMRTTVFADIGTEGTAFRHQDGLRHVETKDAPPTEYYPLFGIEHQITGKLTAHVRYAESTSRPVIWEVLGSSGIPNTSLSAERVREAEAGIDAQDQRSSISVNGYLRRTQDLILLQRINDGTEELFTNVGDARQNGVELAASTRGTLPGEHRLELLFNGAWQHHRLQLPDDAPTVDVPGVPRWAGGLRVRITSRHGTGLELGYRANASAVANSSNGDRVPGHGAMHLRLEHTFRWPCCQLVAFFLVENLLDARYTSFLQLNDPVGRYYNPAPGRSFFGGLSFTFGPG